METTLFSRYPATIVLWLVGPAPVCMSGIEKKVYATQDSTLSQLNIILKQFGLEN
jgi:hypothetical protein